MYSFSDVEPLSNPALGSGLSTTVPALPAPEAEFFRRHGHLTNLRKGAVLMRADAAPRGVYLLLQGKVKVFYQTAPNQRQIFHFYRPGELIGCRPLVVGANPSFQAEAMEPVQALFVPAELFVQHVRLSTSFAAYLLEQQCREFAAWSEHYALMARRPVRQRLAVCLLALHHLFRIPPNPTSVICLSRSDLADYAATTLETTVRILREMKESGLVHIRGRRIVVLDLEALAQMVHAATPEKI